MRTASDLAFLFAALGVGFAPVAFGQEDVTVKTMAESAKVGAEFRAELNYDDHGLEKVTGYDPKATTAVQLQTLKLKLGGNINSNTEYKFRFNLLNPTTTPVDYGYATHWMGAVGFSIGKMKVLQGGWDNMDNGFRDHIQGPYAKNLAFDKYEDMIALHLKAAGKVTLQLVNDVQGQWNTTEHPTFIIGWQGEFGPISPIVDIGTYDNQKSNWVDVGVKGNFSGLKAGLDVKMDTITAKDTTTGKAKESKDTATSYTLKAGYEIKDSAYPWIYVSMYDRKQDKNDAKINSITTDAAGKKTYSFDDNGMAWGVGADFLMLGKGWTPYAAIVSQGGKFAKDDTDVTKEEDKSKMQVRLGMLGEF